MSDAQPFDPIAAGYDDTFSNSPIGQLQRRQVHYFLQQAFPSLNGKKVLELSCGTGVDALWLTQQGAEVWATDISQGMVEQTQNKIQAAGLIDRVRTSQLSIDQISKIPTEEQFDLIFSNFGGFNCLPPEKLQSIAADLAQHLKPDGKLIVVVMGRHCIWENLYFLAKGAWRKAFRRRSRQAISVPLGEGKFIDTWYFSPSEFSNLFTSHFQRKAGFPVGLFIPPSYLDHAFRKRPSWLKRLYRWEQSWQNRQWGSTWADHFYVELELKR